MRCRLHYRGWTVELTNEARRHRWCAHATARDGRQLALPGPFHDRLEALRRIKQHIAATHLRGYDWRRDTSWPPRNVSF